MLEATLVVDTSFLGDVLCAEPLVRAAKQRFPGPLDFLTSAGGAGMLAGHPDLREIMVYDKRGAERGFRGLLSMSKLLRSKRYARVFCSHRSWRTAMLLRLSGIPERICFDNASGAFFYTQRIPYPQQLHEVERNLALVGGGVWQRPRIYPTVAERTRALELVGDEGFVALAPGSIWATKRWPEDYYAVLVQQLIRASKRVVVIGGEEDRQLGEQLVAEGGQNLCGQTNLRESFAVLERAACLVTNDSSPMHMGVAANIPVVAVYCSTLPSFGFSPRGPRDIVLEVSGLACRPCGIHGHPTCPEKHFDCGNKTTPQMVFEAVMERLSS